MEVDQLLGQLPDPNLYADYDVPRSIYGNRSQQRLRFEERALQGRLDELSDKRDKLANDCLLYTSPSPRDATLSRMPSSA